jgi:hypothetical protein
VNLRDERKDGWKRVNLRDEEKDGWKMVNLRDERKDGWKRVIVRDTGPREMEEGRSTLIKKKIKFSIYMRKFRMEQLQSHI